MGNFNFEMDENLHDRLRIQSVKEKETMEEIVRKAIDEYICRWCGSKK